MFDYQNFSYAIFIVENSLVLLSLVNITDVEIAKKTLEAGLFDMTSTFFLILGIMFMVLLINSVMRLKHGNNDSYSSSSKLNKEEKKPHLKIRKNFLFLQDYDYSQITTIWKFINQSYESLIKLNLSNSDRKELNALMEKAENLMIDFEKLYQIGMADKYKKIEKKGVFKKYTYVGYSETMLQNLKEIRRRLDYLLSIQAEKLSSGILSFSIEKEALLNEVETKFENLVEHGNKLLSLIDSNSISMRNEEEFIIKKIVNERLSEVHNDYKNALNKTDDIENIVNVYVGILADLESIFTDYENGVKKDISSGSLQKLLVQKRYFGKRINN